MCPTKVRVSENQQANNKLCFNRGKGTAVWEDFCSG